MNSNSIYQDLLILADKYFNSIDDEMDIVAINTINEIWLLIAKAKTIAKEKGIDVKTLVPEELWNEIDH